MELNCSPIKVLGKHKDAVRSVAFSPDGCLAASASNDKSIKLWNIGSGVCIKTLEGHEHFVLCASFCSDGKSLLSGGWDKTVRLWSILNNQGASKILEEAGHFYSIAFSVDSSLTLLGMKYVAILREIPSGLHRHIFKTTGIVYCVAFSPDAKYALANRTDETLALWAIDDGSCLGTLEGHKCTVFSACFSPDGRFIASGSADNTVKLWETASSRCLATFDGQEGRILAVCFSPDGKFVVSGSEEGALRLWDVTSHKSYVSLDNQRQDIDCVSVSPDGNFILSADVDGTVKLWRVSHLH